MKNTANNFYFLSCILDPDEREPKIEKKIDAILNPGLLKWSDPSEELKKRCGVDFIEIPVESWLKPLPDKSDLPLMTVENFVVFIDSNGCLEYAEDVKNACLGIDSRIPVFVGVDHSLSGGVVEAISEKNDLVYVVLDAHFDCILPEIRCGLLQYDAETNPESKYSINNPFIYNRPNSYNADSYMYYLWDWNIVERENTVVAGVVDYPSENAWKIEDDRVQKYLGFYISQEEKGVKIIRAERIRSNPRKIIDSALKECSGDSIYLSIDLDVGANMCCSGVRFSEHNGVSCQTIIEVVKHIIKKYKLVGVDLCEFDPYSSKEKKNSIEIAQLILEIIVSAFNRNN